MIDRPELPSTRPTAARIPTPASLCLMIVITLIALGSANPSTMAHASVVAATTPAAAADGDDDAVTEPDGPRLTGTTSPSTAQRVADTLIWIWLLVALVGAPLLWWRTGRRRATTDPTCDEPTRTSHD
jgi:hypothetical protein